MLKKLFIGLMAAAMIFATGNAFACDDCGHKNADVNIEANAHSYDYDYSSKWNDRAEAFASGNAGGTLDVHANGKFIAVSLGDLDADSDSFAKAWSKDTGLTSKAGAIAMTRGSADSFGLAFGPFGCREYVDSALYVSGEVYQWNTAGETGYDAGFVEGSNQSGGSFYTFDRDYDHGKWSASDVNEVDGGMITVGGTKVSIDPYGNHRSFVGTTANMTKVKSGHLLGSNVYGNGYVRGVITKGGSYAGGTASFSYTGGTCGAGIAHLKGNVNHSKNHSSVSVKGKALSVGNGGFNQID